MNFFEQQERARRQTRWLIIAFILAVVLMVLAIDLILIVAFGPTHSLWAWREMLPQLAVLDTIIVAVIVLASFYRTMDLRSGGAAVATELGGVRVDADTSDLLRQRLRNVVEEMALASGVPVPDIFVLEREAGINAFAAGFTPADAAVAVTRGALEKLNREQLQGVIAHEFSHILNGDMRLNIRMVGVLFGIFIISIIGRQIMHIRSSSFRSRSDSRAGIVVLGAAIAAAGWVGLFLGRWIRASISRNREFLADASAVQFTRNPAGIAGALKTIAVDNHHGLLDAASEEVSHMMFEAPSVERLFASHPPLMERIRHIEPDFNEAALAAFARQIQQRRLRELDSRPEKPEASDAVRKMIDPANWIETIGNPDGSQLLQASVLAASLPPAVQSATRSVEWAPEVLLALLLDPDPDIREQQLLRVTEVLGADSEAQLSHLWRDLRHTPAEHKLPLIEMTFPALKRRPLEDLRQLQALIDELIRIDNRVDVFEYATARMLQGMIDDLLAPAAAGQHERRKLNDLALDAVAVISVVARLGHEDTEQADIAVAKGLKILGLKRLEEAIADDWKSVLDVALKRLDKLGLQEKQQLLRALLETISSDGEVGLVEAELLRAICAILHLPLPLLPVNSN